LSQKSVHKIVEKYVVVRQYSIKGIRLDETSCVDYVKCVFDWDLCEEEFYIETH